MATPLSPPANNPNVNPIKQTLTGNPGFKQGANYAGAPTTAAPLSGNNAQTLGATPTAPANQNPEVQSYLQSLNTTNNYLQSLNQTGNPNASADNPYNYLPGTDTGQTPGNLQASSPLYGLLGNEQNQIGLAQGQQALGNEGLAIQQYLGGQNIGMQQQQYGQDILQMQQNQQQQQAGLNLQEQYQPIMYGYQQQQFGLQGQGLGLQEQGVKQQEGQAANTQAQQTESAYGNAAASGSTNTAGAANQHQQINYNYAQQMENLNRSLQQIGLSKQGLAVSEKQAGSQYAETQAQDKIQQQAINNVAQNIGFDSGMFSQRINYALDQLNLSGNLSAGQIAMAYQDQLNGIANPLAGILPYILQSANIPGLAGLGV